MVIRGNDHRSQISLEHTFLPAMLAMLEKSYELMLALAKNQP